MLPVNKRVRADFGWNLQKTVAALKKEVTAAIKQQLGTFQGGNRENQHFRGRGGRCDRGRAGTYGQRKALQASADLCFNRRKPDCGLSERRSQRKWEPPQGRTLQRAEAMAAPAPKIMSGPDISLGRQFCKYTMSVLTALFSCSTNSKINSSPTLPTKVGNKTYEFLYDTGAGVSLMHERVYRAIPTAMRAKLVKQPTRLKATSASGHNLRIKGHFEFPLQINGETYFQAMYVTPDIQYSGIIGIDAITNHQMKFDPISHQVEVPPPPAKRRVLAGTNVYIPAGAARILPITVQTDEELSVGSEMLLKIKSPHEDSILEEDVLTKCHAENKAKVIVTNTGLTDIKVPRGGDIGYCVTSQIRPDDVVTVDDGLELDQPQGSGSPTRIVNYVKNELTSERVPFRATPTGPRPATHTPLNQEKAKFIEENASLTHLDPQLKSQFLQMFKKYHNAIASSSADLGCSTIGEHRILTTDDKPTYVRQWPIPIHDRQFVADTIKDWLKIGVIRRSLSAYNAPLLVVSKKDPEKTLMKKRICLDYRQLNAKCLKSHYRLPQVSEMLQRLGGSKYYANLDLVSAFYQLNLAEEDRHKTAFSVVNQGSFEFCRTPMGCSYAPASMQRALDLVLSGLEDKCIAYIDDLLIIGTTKEQLLENVASVLQRLQSRNIKINLKKSTFMMESVEFLGFECSAEGYRASKRKTELIKTAPMPTTVKQVRSFVGLCSFFRNSIPRYSDMARHLTALTRKDSLWTGHTPLPEEAQKAFKDLQQALSQRPLLVWPDLNKEMELYVDASDYAVSSCLAQRDDQGEPKVIGYHSRQLQKHEKAYSSYVNEQLACCDGVEHWHQYLKGQRFKLFTDNKPICTLSSKNQRTLNRLQLLLTSYDFEMLHIEGTKNPSDFGSRYLNGAPATVNAIHQDLYFGSQNIRIHQMKDPLCTILADMLNWDPPIRPQQKAPDHLKGLHKHAFKMAPFCQFKNGIFYYLMNKPNDQVKALPILPASLQAQCMNDAHYSKLSGHGKLKRTLDRIQEYAYWPTMSSDLANLIEHCDVCQRSRPPTKHPQTELGKFQETTAFNELVAVDLFGPILTDQEKKYIQVCADKHTGYTVFHVVPSKDTALVAKGFLDNWVKYFHLPAQLHSDQGGEYRSQLHRDLMKVLGIRRSYNTSLHPQCNATAETKNKHIVRYLRSFVAEFPQEWEPLVGLMQASWNSSVSRGTGFSPYELVTGQKPITPFANPNLIPKQFYGDSYDQFIASYIPKMKEFAIKNRRQFVEEYENRYNDSVRPVKYHVNDLVLLWAPNKKTSKNPKLQNAYFGPYQIVEFPSPHNAVLKNLQIPTQKKQRVHINRLRPYKANRELGDMSEESQGETKKERIRLSKRAAEHLQPSSPYLSPRRAVVSTQRRQTTNWTMPDDIGDVETEASGSNDASPDDNGLAHPPSASDSGEAINQGDTGGQSLGISNNFGETESINHPPLATSTPAAGLGDRSEPRPAPRQPSLDPPLSGPSSPAVGGAKGLRAQSEDSESSASGSQKSALGWPTPQWQEYESDASKLSSIPSFAHGYRSPSPLSTGSESDSPTGKTFTVAQGQQVGDHHPARGRGHNRGRAAPPQRPMNAWEVWSRGRDRAIESMSSRRPRPQLPPQPPRSLRSNTKLPNEVVYTYPARRY